MPYHLATPAMESISRSLFYTGLMLMARPISTSSVNKFPNNFPTIFVFIKSYTKVHPPQSPHFTEQKWGEEEVSLFSLFEIVRPFSPPLFSFFEIVRPFSPPLFSFFEIVRPFSPPLFSFFENGGGWEGVMHASFQKLIIKVIVFILRIGLWL
jgi:hypothetical protein